MKCDGTGGASTLTGKRFEETTDLSEFLKKHKDYRVVESSVFYKNYLIALIFKQNGLYDFLGRYDINWETRISKKLIPDACIFVKNTLYIIECKSQHTQGSTDEKLQTCDFKKKQYQKLFSGTNINVEYVYILNDWFKQKMYEDVLRYIENCKCHYCYWESISLEIFGLPISEIK